MPETLSSLVDEGIIEEVLRPLMSGKEAQIYLVVAAGREYVAKIYKEAQDRTFKHRTDYTEGRKVRNSRDQRAIDKRSKHGRGQDETAWRSTEVDMIYRLQAAGVRVPAPYQFIDDVLIMELVTGANGEPAPRIGEVKFSPEEATIVFEKLIREVVRMLCAGVVHGDLSDFNVLLGADGPVIIDFPQAIDPAKNQNARKLLLRDVDNLHRFHARFVPAARRMPYAEEMWALYEKNQLTPETLLSGHYRASQKKADTDALLELVGEVNEDERQRRARVAPAAAGSPRPRRVEVIVEKSNVRGGMSSSLRGRHKGPALSAQPPARAAGNAAPRQPSLPHRGVPERGIDRAALNARAETRDANLAPATTPARRRRRRKPRLNGAAPIRHDAAATRGAEGPHGHERSQQPAQPQRSAPPDRPRQPQPPRLAQPGRPVQPQSQRPAAAQPPQHPTRPQRPERPAPARPPPPGRDTPRHADAQRPAPSRQGGSRPPAREQTSRPLQAPAPRAAADQPARASTSVDGHDLPRRTRTRAPRVRHP
jgi:RIO kinase 1